MNKGDYTEITDKSMPKAYKMAQQVKRIAANRDHPSSILMAHVLQELDHSKLFSKHRRGFPIHNIKDSVP